MTTWAERAAVDPSLRAFVDGEIGRAHVELQALRVEHERDQEAIKTLQAKVEELQRNQRTDRRTAPRMTDKPSERSAR